MKAIIAATLAFGMTGCGALQRTFTKLTGELSEKCSRTGVVYLQSDSGLAALVDKEGRPVGCAP